MEPEIKREGDKKQRMRPPKEGANPVLIGRIATHPNSVLILTDIQRSAETEADGGIKIKETPIAARLVAGDCPISCWEFGPEGMTGKLVYIAAWNWVPSRNSGSSSQEEAEPVQTRAGTPPSTSDPATASAIPLYEHGHIEALVAPLPIDTDHFLDQISRYDFSAFDFNPLEEPGPELMDVSETVSHQLQEAVQQLLDAPTHYALTQGASQITELSYMAATQSLLRVRPGGLSAHGRLIAKSAIYWPGNFSRRLRAQGKKSVEHPYFILQLAFGADTTGTEFHATLLVQSPDSLALHMGLSIGKWYLFSQMKTMKMAGARSLVWNGGAIKEVQPPAPSYQSQGVGFPYGEWTPNVPIKRESGGAASPVLVPASQGSVLMVSCYSCRDRLAQSDIPFAHQTLPPMIVPLTDPHLITYTGVITARPHPQLYILDGSVLLFLIHRARASDAALEPARKGCTVECTGVHAVRTSAGIALAGCNYSGFRVVDFPRERTPLPGPVEPGALGDWEGWAALSSLTSLTGLPGIAEATSIVASLRRKFPGASLLPDVGKAVSAELRGLLGLFGLRKCGREGTSEFLEHGGGCIASSGGFGPVALLEIGSLKGFIANLTEDRGSQSGDPTVPHSELSKAMLVEHLERSVWLIGKLEIDKAGRPTLVDDTGNVVLSVAGGIGSGWIRGMFALRDWTLVLEEALYLRCSRADFVCVEKAATAVDAATVLTDQIDKASKTNGEPSSNVCTEWLVLPGDIKPMTLVYARIGDRVKQQPKCRIEAWAVPLAPGPSSDPVRFQWDVEGDWIRFKPFLRLDKMVMASGVELNQVKTPGGLELDFLVGKPRDSAVLHSVEIHDEPPLLDCAGKPVFSTLATDLSLALRGVQQSLLDLAISYRPPVLSIAKTTDLRAHTSKVYNIGNFTPALGSFQGVVVQKEFRVERNNILRGVESMERYGVGTGAKDRILCIRLCDIAAEDVIDFYMDCSNQEWPLNILPGWMVHIHRCTFRVGSHGRKIFAHALPGVTAVIPIRFVPQEERDKVLLEATFARGNLKLSDWLAPKNANLRATSRIRCRITKLRSLVLRYRCTKCGFLLQNEHCPTSDCDSRYYVFDAEANCTVYDGTAEAQAFMEGPNSIFAFLRVAGLLEQKLRELTRKSPNGQLMFHELRKLRGEDEDDEDLEDLLNDDPRAASRHVLRSDERLLMQCCTRQDIYREIVLLVRRVYKDDAEEKGMSTVKLGTVSVPITRGPRLAFRVLGLEQVDLTAEAARLVAKLI